MRIKNADVEGRIEGPVSDGGSREGSPISFGGAFGAGETGTGSGGGELFAAAFPDSGGGDSGDGTTEAPKKRRGRPPGGGKSATGKLSADKLAAARGKFADTLAGAVGFGISWYGIHRANKYKKISPALAQAVYGCYQIPEETARSVGEPLADTFIAWFPKYVEPVSKGIDPGLAVARLVIILQQTSENEQRVVQVFRTQMTPSQNPANGNGNEPNQPTEDTVSEWMKQQAPQPEEIHPQAG